MMESSKRKAGIYIHVPFCVKKCSYCAFLSAPSDAEGIEKYVNALIDEINGCKANFTSTFNTNKYNTLNIIKNADDELRNRNTINNIDVIDSIYLGGGTPSLLSIEQIEKILNTLYENFSIDTDVEITLEANPGTLGETDAEVFNKLSAYKKIGINRLSMGVQSMNDEVLKYLGRIHNAEEVRRDFHLARKAGFDNINLDHILSVPYIKNLHNDSNNIMNKNINNDSDIYNKNDESGNHNINKDSDIVFNNKLNTEYLLNAERDVLSIIDLNPEHISCYSLQIEEGTLFGKMYEDGTLCEIPDELDREIYHKVSEILKLHGYDHYEISNFAKPGFESRHNSKYWNMSDYIGLGLGASGFVNGVRYKNTENMQEYLLGNYIAEEYKNTEHDNISEAVFTGLRRKTGIKYREVFTDASDEENVERAFWNYYKEAHSEAESFVQTGHLIIDEKGIRLTETGIDISNKIMSLFV